jgi:hypothetical protein
LTIDATLIERIIIDASTCTCELNDVRLILKNKNCTCNFPKKVIEGCSYTIYTFLLIDFDEMKYSTMITTCTTKIEATKHQEVKNAHDSTKMKKWHTHILGKKKET